MTEEDAPLIGMPANLIFLLSVCLLRRATPFAELYCVPMATLKRSRTNRDLPTECGYVLIAAECILWVGPIVVSPGRGQDQWKSGVMGIPGEFWAAGIGGCGANCLSHLRSRWPSRARVKTGVVTSAPDSVGPVFADATLEIEPQRYGTTKRSLWRNRTVHRVGNSKDAAEPLLADETTQFVTWFEENMRDAVFCAVIGGVGGHTSSVCLPAAVNTLAKMTEMETLRLFNGKRSVRLLDADRDLGAMLLQRVEPGTMLWQSLSRSGIHSIGTRADTP